MTFQITEDQLTNAIFNDSALEAFGAGTKAEARQQARRMLEAEDLLEAAKAMYALIVERQHYITPNLGSERPEFETLAGCAGAENLRFWNAAIAKAGGKECTNETANRTSRLQGHDWRRTSRIYRYADGRYDMRRRELRCEVCGFRVYERVLGAPFQPGDSVRVVRLVDDTVDYRYRGRSGTVQYLEYSCGCGQTYPDNPMIGVRFAESTEEFWPEELLVIQRGEKHENEDH